MATSEGLKFSIIIPVYNVERYLGKCLDSIVNQTFKDFEVICVNDGATDNSGKILKEYAAKDKRFIIIEQENQGTGAARNNALNIAKGEYIVFVDPDDWIELNALEELQKTFNETGCEVIHFNYMEYFEQYDSEYVSNAAKSIKKRFDYDIAAAKYYNWDILKSCKDKERHGGFSNIGGMQVWTKAYRKSFIEETDAKFSPTSYSEDQLFSIAVILNAKKIIYLDKVLYHYRRNRSSITNGAVSGDFEWLKSIETIKDYLCRRNLYDKCQNDFSEQSINILCAHYGNVAKENEKQYMNKCRGILSESEYRKFKKRFLGKRKKKLPLFQEIFSISNTWKQAQKYKIITILGIQLKFHINPPPQKNAAQKSS